MGEIVLEAIKNCEWGTSKFLIFSSNVFAPLIYYSHLGVLVITLFFGLFIYSNNRKGLTNRLMFYLSLSISIWLFSDLVLWATEIPKITMFFWSLEIIFEPIIYILALFFFYSFVDAKVPARARIFSYLLLLPTLILASTNFGLTGYDLTNCDRVAVEGLLPKYGYAIELVFVFWIIILAFNRYRLSVSTNEKTKIFFVALGIGLFLLSFSLSNIAEVLTENWYIGQIGYIGIPIFFALLSYLIVKFKAFNIKVIGSQVLVAATWFLILSILFIRVIENARIVVAATLALFSVLGIYLIRSVKREVEQREKIEKLAQSLEAANEKLKELDQLKSEFLSLATHQIRSPLTAIKGYSSMLLDGDFGLLPQKAKDSVETIMKSCQNLIDIVGDFLNISRIEQGRMVYEKSIFDLRDLVQEVIKEIKPNIEKAGLNLIVEIPIVLDAKVNVDRGKIKQVIGNVIDNAIKYTPKGEIKISMFKDGSKVKISVQDSGVGIDPKEIDKLFNKFSRAKDASKVNVTGTGLGLYIAKKMVEAHSGDIKVSSEGVGHGTTFTIELPHFA